MPLRLRRRLLRPALAIALVVGGAAFVAQLAGVTGTTQRSNDLLIGEQTNVWLVQMPEASTTSVAREHGRSLGRAVDDVGGGKVGGELVDGWREVRLGEDVTSAEAEALFGGAGAVDVEPVVPRTIYDEPQAISDPASVASGQPAPAARAAGDEPGAIDDAPNAFATTSFSDALRSGKLKAARLREQWALEQPSDVDIDGTEAWTKSTGSGAIVAVIDTGVDASHPDLRGRVLDGVDFSGAETGATYDAVGHGTHIASIIAAGGSAMAGVAPDAKILPLKVFRDSASRFSMDGYVRAIRYAVDHGADVINVSLGCGGTPACYSQAEFDAIAYANERGVLLVAAAGNGNAAGVAMDNDSPRTPDFPSGYDLPNIVSVTSTTRLGGWSSWANYGARTVDVAAPGEGILVASPGGSYTSVTGTSFAAPHASGVLALLAASIPSASVADLRTKLEAGVDPVAELRARTVAGGSINAQSALAAAQVPAAQSRAALKATAPRLNARLAAPATMTWQLPVRWRAVRMEVRGPGGSWRVPLRARSSAAVQPRAAWRSGTYRWRIVAADAQGRTKATPWRAYRLAPRTSASVTSGRFSARGQTLRLRVGYAATTPVATTRVRILDGRRVLHSGRATTHRSHVRGAGYPRRGWFTYTAPLARTVRRGTLVTIEVTVSAGGARSVQRVRARVA